MTNRPALTVAIGDTWQPRYLVYFGMALVCLMLVTNVLNLKFISVFGLPMIGSQFTYVFSLILADVMAEVYGYRRVRRVVLVSMACIVFYAIAVNIVIVLPPTPDYANNEAFHTVFSTTPRITIASIAAYLTVELINSFVMSRLKIKYTARYFYGRALVSVGLAQLANVFVFNLIAFAGIMPLPTIMWLCFSSWAIVMFTELVILPLTKQLAVRVKHAEGIEHYDSAPTPTA